MENFKIRILGVMTGTSCDGLDAACIEADPEAWTPLWNASSRYPQELRKRVLAFQKTGSLHTSRAYLELHRDLGEWYASALEAILARNSPTPDLIANHGQTVAHYPAARRKGTTLQLGDPTRIALRTGITVISHFRDGDMAAGGEGAPLVPLFHRVLAHALGLAHDGVAIHNIGGISNLTYIGPGDKILAFDTGPGNIWIDAAAEAASRGKLKFDAGGKLALSAEPDLKAVRAVLKNPYFSKRPPKSTGRDDFPFSILKSKTKAKGPELVATATAVTIESIAQAYERFILKPGLPLVSVFVSGGGAKNRALLEGIQKELPGVGVESLEEAGFDPQLIEAQAFAYFGLQSLLGKPIGGSWTGAREFAPPGQITPGANWIDVVTKLGRLLGP